jgi:hypothetical protein
MGVKARTALEVKLGFAERSLAIVELMWRVVRLRPCGATALVAQNIASWNRVTSWLRQIERLRVVDAPTAITTVESN